MKLLVTGGNGFIGRRVCARAVVDGHEVHSVARSGPPAPEHCGEWAEAVTWHAADVFSPQDWRGALPGVDTVVHSIGTIDEAPNSGVTFERINGDSALVAALEAERAGADRFVYISSSATPPLIREAYLTARRRAEAAIADLGMTIVIPRFGPVYGPDQPHFSTLINRLYRAVGSVDLLCRLAGDDQPFAVADAGKAVYRLATTADPPTGPVAAAALAELTS